MTTENVYYQSISEHTQGTADLVKVSNVLSGLLNVTNYLL